jgi:GNAT superfamily N-acetyltransferase
MLTLKRTNAADKDFQQLILQLDHYLKEVDGDEHAFFAALNKSDTIGHVLVCYDEKELTGCGAFRLLDKETVEIKRMFVLPQHRKKGIAAFILKELEQWAKELNYKKFILETGIEMTNAIQLYKKQGYRITENYGPYIGNIRSVCMKKIIS